MEASLGTVPVSISCHPTNNLIGVGFIDGSVSISSYDCNTSTSNVVPRKRALRRILDDDDDLSLRLTQLHLRKHKRSVRRLQFTPITGDRLIVATQNLAICQWDVETGRKIRCLRVAHEDPPYSLINLSENETATGDEYGIIKLWDWRIGDRFPCVASFDGEDDMHCDIVNDFAISEDKKTLMAVSADATLSAWNLRKKALEMQSEEMNAELLSVAITKNGGKVVCGSGEGGYVEIFNWNEFGNITERMQTGHPDSVDCLITIDHPHRSTDQILASASSFDGTIRLLQFSPNGDLGLIGDHVESASGGLRRKASCAGAGGGIEALCLTFDNRYLVSCGQDEKLKFWDVDNFVERLSKKCQSDQELEDSDDSDNETKASSRKRRKKARKQQEQHSRSNVLEFFDDLAEEDNKFYDHSDEKGSDDEDHGGDDDGDNSDRDGSDADNTENGQGFIDVEADHDDDDDSEDESNDENGIEVEDSDDDNSSNAENGDEPDDSDYFSTG